MPNGMRRIGGLILAFLAVGIALTEVGLHLYAALAQRQYDVSWVMLLIALVMGFVGFYILDPRRAKEGGKFLVDNTINVLQVFRRGRRKDDQLAVVLEDVEGRKAEIAVPEVPTMDDKQYDQHSGRRETDVIDLEILPNFSEEDPHRDRPRNR